jgi:hypothetical protein
VATRGHSWKTAEVAAPADLEALVGAELREPVAELVPRIVRELVAEQLNGYALAATLVAAPAPESIEDEPRAAEGTPGRGKAQGCPGPARPAASRKRMRRLLPLAVLAAAVVIAGVAYAAIPGSDGLISGCYKPKASGELRVIDTEAGDECLKSEKALSWPSAGSVKPIRHVARYGAPVDIPPGEFGFPQAHCQPGEEAVSGAFSGNLGMEFVASLPLRADGAFPGEGDVPVSWQYTVRNTTTATFPFRALVICATSG